MSDTLDILENLTYDELNEGDSATLTRSLSEEDLILFAAASGDVNPLHLDQEYASGTRFKEQIGHGMWAGSLISAALATVMPGPGTIYLEQSLVFRHPVKVGDTLSVNLRVLRKEPRNRITLGCDIRNQDGQQVLNGEARVIAPSEKIRLPSPVLPQIRVGH